MTIPDRVQRRIERLDPATQYEQIHQLSSGLEFPRETRLALSRGIFATFAVPSIAATLDATGQFAGHAAARYQSTILRLREISVHGLETAAGQAAISHLNRVHRSFQIRNDDMLFVLAVFAVFPARWIERYGWRQPTPAEVSASVRYYRRLGELMGISGIPGDYAGMAGIVARYEQQRYAATPAGQRLAAAAITAIAGMFPPGTRWAVRPCVAAWLGEPLCRALGIRPAGPCARTAVAAVLLGRRRIVRVLKTAAALWAAARMAAVPLRRRALSGLSAAHRAHRPLP